MKKRMWALVLAGVLVISQCDTVVLAADAAKTPVVYQATSVTPNKTSIDAVRGSVTFTVDGAVKSCVVKEGDTVLEQDKDYTVDDRSDSGKYIVIFNENTQAVARTFTVSLDGVETTITQAAKTSAEISSVTEVSSTKLADGRTEYVYNVEGTNLEEVGVVLFRNVNSKFDAGQYSVSREGTGNVQKVTVTIAAWADLNPDEFDEKKGVISGTTCFYPTSSGSQFYWMAKAQKSVEIKKEESSENPDVPQFDATTLKVKVVDKNGNPVSGVALYLKPDQKGYENLKLSVSDDNGKASYKCDNHHEMNDSTYTLLPTEDSGYICDSAIGIEFDQDDDWNSYITTVDSEKFTGQEVVLTVAKAEEPVTVTPDRTKISAGEESVMFTVSKPVEICVVKEGDKVLLEGTDYMVNNLSDTRYIVTFPENTQTVERVYTVILNGVETTITQAAKEAEASKISSVTQVSRTFLDDGRTEYVYNVTGANLKEVGVLVHKGFNSRFSTSQYTVAREGEGTTQKVTVTIAPWDQLGEPFDEEINGFVRFYPTTSDMGSLNYDAQLNIQVKKDEGKEKPTVVTPDKTKIPANGGQVRFAVSRKATNISITVDGKELVEDEDYEITSNWDDEIAIYFWENDSSAARTITVTLNGTSTQIVQEGKTESKISAVNLLSRTILEDGRTEYAYEVTGEALEAVGIRVKASINETVKEDKYEVKREGTGTKQIVTITFAPWSQLNILDEKEKELNWEIRFYPNGDRTGSYESADVKLIKDEKPAAADVIESMTVSAKEVDYVNGKTEVTVKGTDLNAGNLEVSVESGVTVGEITGTSDELKFTVTFPTNPYTTAKDYKVSVNIRGKEDTKDATITVKGANTITGAEALKNPSYILDVRKEDTIAATGKIPGSQACPQFPTDDASLDEKMQAFAERYKDNTDPIYIMCNSGKVGAPRATKNLLAAGIDPARIFTILGGAGDADIQAALVKAPETDALKEAIAKAKEVDSAKYTTESYEAVANALKTAEEVLNKESATQAEVDDAVKALQTAMEGLEEKPEEPVAPVTDNLKAAIAKAKEVDSAKYTTESYKVVENALKAAEEVLDNANATQEDVNAAETALLAAMDGLKVKEETPSEEPEKPNDDKKTDDKKTDDKKTEDKKTGASDKKSGSPQTGDAANALPFAVAALSSLMAAGVVVKKRKED